MDILIVSHLYPTPADSVPGIFVHQQAQALQERGHSVKVLSPTPYVPNVPHLPNRWARFRDTPDRSQIDGIDVSYPKYVSLPSLHTLPLVAKSVRRSVDSAISNLEYSPSFSPDVVNAHVPLPDGYACLPACRRLDVPLVTTVHGASIQISSENRLCRRQIRTVFQSSAEVVFNSEVLLGKAKKYFNGFNRARVVPNGVPLAKLDSASAAELPANFSENRMVVASVGSLQPTKGQGDVFEALQNLPAESRPNYLLIGDGPKREELERKATALDLPVHFTGSVPHEDVFSYLKSTDIMALPSTEEAFGIAYIEAMACESPVVGCEGEGPSEFVDHGETGFLVPPNDPKAITDILTDLHDNPSKVRRMGKKASEYVRNNLTWAENARKNEKIYQSAIEK
ncbi:glycosyltransferase [Halobacterium salinarum]|uniref:glycosyltransferase n=1 Tax=Halobacterium salinarum TaxID=2242 RepID=UPI00255581EC|nr:glycosyltransferase [Halobacterium salinarum]MDL0141621.1 glycosyltransferase [Halobacterium salinarum]